MLRMFQLRTFILENIKEKKFKTIFQFKKKNNYQTRSTIF